MTKANLIHNALLAVAIVLLAWLMRDASWLYTLLAGLSLGVLSGWIQLKRGAR